MINVNIYHSSRIHDEAFREAGWPERKWRRRGGPSRFGIGKLVPTSEVRVSAPTLADFGKSWTLANLLILLRLHRSEVPDRIRALWCRDFRSAVLGLQLVAATNTRRAAIRGKVASTNRRLEMYLTRRAESARSGAALPRCAALIPYAVPARRYLPRSISSTALSGFGGRS